MWPLSLLTVADTTSPEFIAVTNSL
jgi:hypothetical protein